MWSRRCFHTWMQKELEDSSISSRRARLITAASMLRSLVRVDMYLTAARQLLTVALPWRILSSWGTKRNWESWYPVFTILSDSASMMWRKLIRHLAPLLLTNPSATTLCATIPTNGLGSALEPILIYS